MQDSALVSVIMIFLNAEHFIEEAIESVFQQTYTNWELLLVDDGSTDASTRLARQYAAEHPGRVHYLEHEYHRNRGMSRSRNLGIRHAKGEFTAFLDADDIWLPKKLERQVPVLNAQPEAGMVFGPTYYWFSWTGDPDAKVNDHVSNLIFPPNSLVRQPDSLIASLTGPPPATCSILLRRSLIDKLSAWEESFRGLFEDQVFLAKVYANEAIYVSDECLARYRMQPDSSCYVALREGTYHPARYAYLEWLEAYWTEQGLRESDVWQALQERLWRYRHPWRHRWSARTQHFKHYAEWFSNASSVAVRKLKRAALSRGAGSIKADPNPVLVTECHASHRPRGLTTIAWTSRGVDDVEVHLDAPHGPLLNGTGSSQIGSVRRWVEDGAVFYLQDVSGGKPLVAAHTLDMVRVTIDLAGKLVPAW